jgi:hypothetical protein
MNRVHNQVAVSSGRKNIHARHVSVHLNDPNTHHPVVSASLFVEKSSQQSVPFHRGQADGTARTGQRGRARDEQHLRAGGRIGKHEVAAGSGRDTMFSATSSLGALRFYFSHSHH